MTPKLMIFCDTTQPALSALEAVLAVHRPDCVAISGEAGGAPEVRAARPVVEGLQKRGIAALIVDDAALARTLKADGVHLRAPAGSKAKDGAIVAAFEEARSILGGRFIVGADAGGSRHVAMQLGEAGADYVAFGADVGTDEIAELYTRADYCGWWAEVFQVPVVACGVTEPAEAADLAALQADVLAVFLVAGQAAGEQVARVSALMAAASARHQSDHDLQAGDAAP